jgi:hypothetical protein
MDQQGEPKSLLHHRRETRTKKAFRSCGDNRNQRGDLAKRTDEVDSRTVHRYMNHREKETNFRSAAAMENQTGKMRPTAKTGQERSYRGTDSRRQPLSPTEGKMDKKIAVARLGPRERGGKGKPRPGK